MNTEPLTRTELFEQAARYSTMRDICEFVVETLNKVSPGNGPTKEEILAAVNAGWEYYHQHYRVS